MTHQTPPAQRDRCPSLRPCWFQRTRTCQHHPSCCWKSSICLLASEDWGTTRGDGWKGKEEEEEEADHKEVEKRWCWRRGGGGGKKEDKWKEVRNMILRHVSREGGHSVTFSVSWQMAPPRAPCTVWRWVVAPGTECAHTHTRSCSQIAALEICLYCISTVCISRRRPTDGQHWRIQLNSNQCRSLAMLLFHDQQWWSWIDSQSAHPHQKRTTSDVLISQWMETKTPPKNPRTFACVT